MVVSTQFYSSPLTRHLSDEQVSSLDQAISNLSDRKFKEFLEDLNGRSPFTSSIWKLQFSNHLKWPLYAFKAVKEGKISPCLFGTIAILASGAIELLFKKKTISYEERFPGTDNFTLDVYIEDDRSKLSPFAEFFSPVAPSDEKYEKYLDHFGKFFKKICRLSEFKNQVEKLPLNERQLFLIRLPRTPINTWSMMYAAILEATQHMGYAYFEPIEEEKGLGSGSCRNRFLVFASLSVYQIYVKIMYCGYEQKIVPILGSLSAREVFQYRQKFERVVGVSIPDLIPVPTSADGYWTGPFFFAVHDLYHLFKNQSCSYNHWILLNRITQILFDQLEKEEFKEDLEQLLCKLIDAEMMQTSALYYIPEPFSSVFTAEGNQKLWDSHGGKWKNLIVLDMKKNHSFWRDHLKDNDLTLYQMQ